MKQTLPHDGSPDILVSLVVLPPMKCVAFRDCGREPELATEAMVAKFMEDHGISDPTRFRSFGFNNPMQGTPHGYERLLRVPEDFEVRDKSLEKRRPGGMYAVIRAKGLKNVFEQAKLLSEWVMGNERYALDYPEGFDMKTDACPELEEAISPAGTPPEELVMDYYIPVRPT